MTSTPSRGWFATRALLALLLLVGFYALALGMVAALAWFPYAEWAEVGRELAGKLGGAGPAAEALDALVSKLRARGEVAAAATVEPDLGGVPEPQRQEHAPRVLANAIASLLGQSLVEAGGAWQSQIGRPLEIELDGVRFEPWKLAEEAVRDPARLDALVELARSGRAGTPPAAP
jgi:hypothetical protein